MRHETSEKTYSNQAEVTSMHEAGRQAFDALKPGRKSYAVAMELSLNEWCVDNWYAWFGREGGTALTDRRLLGWPGRFADVAQYAVNFYSTGDEVLELLDDNDVDLLDGITSGWVQYCLHHQEMDKGRGVADVLGFTTWSGWGFNGRWRSLHPAGREWEIRYSAEQAAGLSSEHLRMDPVFYPYPGSMTNSVIPLLVRAAHLTRGVPALTPATGRVSVSSVFDDGEYYDLDSESQDNGMVKPHGWPIRSSYRTRWLHSDMKDVAFWYNYKLYEKIVDLGGLR